MRYTQLLTVLCMLPVIGFAQLQITDLNQTTVINFDNTTDSVNNGAYSGLGFHSHPSAGQLDSDAWSYTGPSEGPMAFGDTSVTGDAARGDSDTTVSTGGFYAFNTNNGIGNDNYGLGWKTTINDFSPGTITLKLDNNTDSTIDILHFAYDAKSLNSLGNEVNIEVAYSVDSLNFIALPDLDFTTPTGTLPTEWTSSNLSTTIDSSFAWADGSSIYIRWSSDVPTANPGNEVAIDNITFRAYEVDFLWDGTAWNPGEPSGAQPLSDALVLAGGVASINNSTSLHQIVVEPGGHLNVAVDLSLNDTGYFYADASGYAQVIGDVFGTVLYQSYLESATGRWFNVAIPVDATFDDVTGIPLNATGLAANTNVWYYDAAVDADADGEGDFKPLVSLSAETERIGYQIFAGDGLYFGSGPFTMGTLGTLLDGNQNVVVSDATAEDWNILPNPYPSAISWADVLADNSVLAATYYIQDGSTNDTDYAYISFNGTTGINGGTDNIPPGQSYFVQITGPAPGGVISFNNGQRNFNETQELAKVQSAYDYVKVKTTHLPSTYSDETIIGFDNSFSDARDVDFDGVKMMNGGFPNIYTKTDGVKYAYNGLEDDFSVKSVNVYFQGEREGAYEISLSQDVLPAQWTIILEDKITNVFTDLRKNSYIYNHSGVNSEDRFIMHFDKSGAVGIGEAAVSNIYTSVENNILNISLGDIENADITVYSLDGKKMAEVYRQNGKFSIDMRSWAGGMYIINAGSRGKNLYTAKVINQ